MDLYGNKVQFAAHNGVKVAQAARVVEIIQVPDFGGRFGCLACTSGDSPIWDIEQNVLGF